MANNPKGRDEILVFKALGFAMEDWNLKMVLKNMRRQAFSGPEGPIDPLHTIKFIPESDMLFLC